MKIWAGAWLKWSVCTERRMRRSSATPARCGSRLEMGAPARPCRRNAYGEPRSVGTPLMNAKR
jgi:hypothetical protein